MDHKISKIGTERADRKKGEGVDPWRMQKQRCENPGGTRVKRPFPCAGFSASAPVGEQTGAICQRSGFKEIADGIQRVEPAILGKASFGKRLLFGEQRNRHGWDHHGVHSESRLGGGEGRQF